MKIKAVLGSCIVVLMIAIGCSSNSTEEFSITKLKPPVQEAAGAGLTGSTTGLLDANNFQDRFFSAGPTNILTILGNLDSRLAEIETRASESVDSGACLDNTPTEVSISVYGETFNLQLQCYDDLSGDGLLAFGKKGDTWYLYEKVGAVVTAASATTLPDDKVSVEIYGGVGLSNGTEWSNMSYGGYHLIANNADLTLEMTAGGIGFGFCGVHLKSDGTNVYLNGSEDGVGFGCQATDEICVQNADLGATGSCNSIGVSSFELTGLGRIATTTFDANPVDASDYPSSPNLTLDGTNTDSIHFGPSAAEDLPETVERF
jgi:hypothetical protein